jgi:KUP system potassium uptake protein
MAKNPNKLSILTLGALGIVFGDIGTSPLYALQAAFGNKSHILAINQTTVDGVLSLVIWSLILVVTLKFVTYIMRADNEGEGGIMALIAQVKSHNFSKRNSWLLILLGIIGVSLFYGDGAITPAISVLSAVEGLKVVAPSYNSLIIPIVILIVVGLFTIQRFGTAFVGKLFGPVMILWFLTIALGGVWQIGQYPKILIALSPISAFHFISYSPKLAFICITAVVLAITGVEALYADLGHFGKKPITRAWYYVVFPSLLLCYMGQGAILLNQRAVPANLLIKLFPPDFRLAVLLLSTLATIIASQAVISGIFSLTHQAVNLNFLPRMLVKHTSSYESGQVYAPLVNFILAIAVVGLVLLFGSSINLANAYGIAVSGTIAIDTILFLAIAKYIFKKYILTYVVCIVIFIPIDLLFIGSNMQKLTEGGIIPLTLATAILILIHTWRKGSSIIESKRLALEDLIDDFVEEYHTSKKYKKRIPGSAIYIGQHIDYIPLALKNSSDDYIDLPEKITFVNVLTTNLAHVPLRYRTNFDNLKYDDGISQITLVYGYQDNINIQKDLKRLKRISPDFNYDISESKFYISLDKVVPTKSKKLWQWQKKIYIFLYRNSLSPTDFYRLPIDKTEEIDVLIGI